MDYLVASSPDLFNLENRSATAVPAIQSRYISSRRQARNPSIPLSADGSRKFAIGGFLPLPSISASPICTPTSSTSPQDTHIDDPLLKDCEVYTTAPSSPAITPGSLSLTPSTPTWISTPPTPPPQMVRRSVTCLPRPTSKVRPSASFPATAFSTQNDNFMKRRNSVSSMPLSVAGSHQHDHPTMTRDASDRVAPSLRPSLSRSKPLFHIPNDAGTDTEDWPRVTSSPEHFNEDLSVEGNWSEHESEEDSRQMEKSKDDIRKYHALKELLDTEVGYLLDLRALVTVYLRILPTLACRPTPSTTFARASSSFASSPWVNSHSHAAVSTLTSGVSDPHVVSSLTPSQSKDTQKVIPRYLFSSLEIEILTRNAEEILQIHEQFIRELRKEMAPLGFYLEAYQRSNDQITALSTAIQNTDAAIRIISSKFATEHQASRFAAYQTFCSGHPEALDLVRKIAALRPVEWEAFEQRCSTLVNELELSTTPETASEESDPSTTTRKDRSRAASMSSLEGAVRTLRSRASIHARDPVTPQSEVPVVRKEKTAPRLAFLDYMIKPVQRICKYPLILDQLRSSKSLRDSSVHNNNSNVDVIVESAKQAMKHVASAVDEARHRQDVAMRSALIASRITLGGSPIPSLSPINMALTQPFLSSLGTCLLAGSLDVIHHSAKSAGSNVAVKYLGAFLYLGGYLIFVKVSKGKAYEPKHWFSLMEFDISDHDADAMLPYSFCVSSRDHRFELAAACQREKDAWLQSLRESRNHHPFWVNEPTPSFRFDGKGDLIPSALDDGPFELVNILPTIQSIPELAGSAEYPGLTDSLLVAFGPDVKHRKSPRQDVMLSDPLSRRSSTASVKAIFSPLSSDSDTIVIRRYSASARSRVDQGLHDVISQLCVTARSHACLKDEELFPSPKATNRGVFVRSQSGLSISGMAAKSRLNRHESVRVLRRRSLVDKPDRSSSKKSSASSSSRRQSTAPSITAMSDSDISRPSPSHSPLLPSPSSTSAMSSSNVSPSPSKNFVRSSSSIFFSSIKPFREVSHEPPHEPKSAMKSSRSLVNGVKELFFSHSRSSSALSQTESSDGDLQNTKKRTVGSLKRWAKGSIHRRTRSAPEDPPFTLPDIQKLPALNIPSLDLSGLEYGATIPLTGTPQPYDPPQIPRPSTGEIPRLQSSLLSSGRCLPSTEFDEHASSKLNPLLRRVKV
ncbi:hypothetical protein H0H93_000083 [Arthromyces matolae]|nr:hypothetical protein H0H93_000083 [Arthromyces matolae]